MFTLLVITRLLDEAMILPVIRFSCSFICQGNSTRKQRSDLFGLRVKLPPVTTSIVTFDQKMTSLRQSENIIAL